MLNGIPGGLRSMLGGLGSGLGRGLNGIRGAFDCALASLPSQQHQLLRRQQIPTS